MYIILMDTHKGQTKYCITLNDEDSDIVKITRAKPGTIPGIWHSEKEVKLDSTSQDVYGTSKQNVEKMFQEIADSKEDNKKDNKEEETEANKTAEQEYKEEETEANKTAEQEYKGEETDAKETLDQEYKGEETEANKTAEQDYKEEEIDAKDTPGQKADKKYAPDRGNQDPEKATKAAHIKALTGAIAEQRKKLDGGQTGKGRRTRKNNKRTTRKKNRKGPHSKSNKNKKKHTRGKK